MLKAQHIEEKEEEEEDEDLRTDNKLHCEGAHSLYDPWAGEG